MLRNLALVLLKNLVIEIIHRFYKKEQVSHLVFRKFLCFFVLKIPFRSKFSKLIVRI